MKELGFVRGAKVQLFCPSSLTGEVYMSTLGIADDYEFEFTEMAIGLQPPSTQTDLLTVRRANIEAQVTTRIKSKKVRDLLIFILHSSTRSID